VIGSLEIEGIRRLMVVWKQKKKKKINQIETYWTCKEVLERKVKPPTVLT
jgi:hypothetical protein